MKKLTYLILSLSIIVFSFSCTKENEDNIQPQQSASLTTVLNKLNEMVDDEGNSIPTANPTDNIIFDFCFDFVYPINLIYNTGTTVVVNSFEELIAIILNSNEDLFIIGIEFPFQVEVFNPETGEIEIETIENEQQFIDLLESCSPIDPCICTEIYDPVCVEIVYPNGETEIIEFPNACYAECEGFTQADFIDCENSNNCFDECPTEYDPVCVQIETPYGGVETIEFPNFCYAECEGFTQADLVDCEGAGSCYDNCPTEYDPVCVEIDFPNGETAVIEFPNACYAECEGFTQADFVDCENANTCFDNCPTEYDPVCVEIVNPNGGTEIIEFPNACYAECEGFTQADFVVCENSNTCFDNCPTEYDPVCVEITTPNGSTEIIEFPNACYAECEGFTQTDFVNCN